MTLNYESVLEELERIAENPYFPEDSERNHQAFAKGMVIMLKWLYVLRHERT